jgi:hypothetical protein
MLRVMTIRMKNLEQLSLEEMEQYASSNRKVAFENKDPAAPAKSNAGRRMMTGLQLSRARSPVDQAARRGFT